MHRFFLTKPVKSRPVFGFLTAALLLFSACRDDKGLGNGFSLDSLPLEQLSDYQLFEGALKDLRPGPGLLPYDLNTPLFTDYAEKLRFVYLPEGAQITYVDEATLEYPVGAMLFKNFFFYADARNPALGRRILETRVLALHEDGWKAYSYLWNDAQTEATYRVTGAVLPIEWIQEDGTNRSIQYVIPNQVDCQNCHQIGDPLMPLGPKPRNLNRSYSYADGTVNQLEKWVEKNWLTGLPTSVPRMPIWNDPSSGNLNDRARAYLDVNCAHCHRTEGDADNSGLFLNVENASASALGICKPPVAAGAGSGGFAFDIVPGRPDSSILLYRMNSVALNVMMPEAGRTIIHQEGFELIEAWIASLSPEGCP